MTERAKRVLTMAQEEGRRINAPEITPELLLLGLLRENEGVAAKILGDMGFSINTVRSDLARENLIREDLARLGRGHSSPSRDKLPPQVSRDWFGGDKGAEPATSEIPASLHLKIALEMAEEEALYIYAGSQCSYIGTEHLLLGLLREKDGLPATIWRRLGLSSEAAQLQVLDYFPPRERPENKE